MSRNITNDITLMCSPLSSTALSVVATTQAANVTHEAAVLCRGTVPGVWLCFPERVPGKGSSFLLATNKGFVHSMLSNKDSSGNQKRLGFCSRVITWKRRVSFTSG